MAIGEQEADRVDEGDGRGELRRASAEQGEVSSPKRMGYKRCLNCTLDMRVPGHHRADRGHELGGVERRRQRRA